MAIDRAVRRDTGNGWHRLEEREETVREWAALRSGLRWALGLSALFAVALAIRLVYLMEVPGFTDESIDVLLGMGALRGQWTLVDGEPYIGSLFNYLMAGGFLLLGTDGYVPRLVVTLLGAFTVVLTYLLARRLEGRWAGLLAAGLMATSGVAIVDGHIAWSNCTTPLFTTAAVLLLVESMGRQKGWILVPAGLFFGLALQTHPSVVLLAPALVLFYLFGGVERRVAPQRVRAATSRSKSPVLDTDPLASLGARPVSRARRLLTPWPWLALVVAVAAYGNVIAYNLSNPDAWAVASMQKSYAYVPDPTADSYLGNLQLLAATLIRMVGSSFSGGEGLLEQLSVSTNIPFVAAMAIGVLYSLWRRRGLPLLVLAFGIGGIPYFNKNYEFPEGARYLGYMLPFAYILIALPIVRFGEWVWRRARLAAAIPVVLSIAMLAIAVVGLLNYYQTYQRQGVANATVLALEEELRARQRASVISEVLLDPQLDWFYTAPGGRAGKALDMLLTVEGVPHRTVWMEPANLAKETADVQTPVAVVITPASRERLGNRFSLLPMDVVDRPYLNRDEYWVYLLRPPQK